MQTGAQIESRDVRMTELLTIDREAIKQFQLLLFRELPYGLSAELAVNLENVPEVPGICGINHHFSSKQLGAFIKQDSSELFSTDTVAW